MKKTALTIIFTLALALCLDAAQKPGTFKSPDGRISVELTCSDGALSYIVSRDGVPAYTMKDISFTTGTRTLPAGKVKIGKTRHIEDSFSPCVPLKFSTVKENYNETVLTLSSDCQMVVRVMDNAVAYRFVLNGKDDIEIFDDHFRLEPAEGFTARYQTAESFNTSYEEPYRSGSLAQWAASDRSLATVPFLLSAPGDRQLLIGESDVDDYPHQFLTTDGTAIVPTYPKAPLKWIPDGDRDEIITEEAEYIAKTAGKRSLPWRWVAVTDSKGIIEQTIPAQLSRRCVLDDTSWIKPGQVSWEWWNGASPFGPDVDFVTGCNLETYKYYADFASKFGIEYILLDEDWAKDTRDPYTSNDDLDLHELIEYCNGIGVKVMLWLPWLTVEQNLDKVFKTYAEWGISAVKIDFQDHADQWMVNFYKRATAEAAKYKLIVDWHGAFTPAGLEYEYPNLISYEGIRGLEQMEGCKPENTLLLPFIRNAVGAADFTPGGMNNMQPEYYRACRPNSGAMGTRAFQMALYIVLESGVQMLADNPTRYYQNEDCTRFISGVPTTWDETRALEAEAGEYVIVAKRKGDKWYVGGITNGNSRDFSLKLDFLGEGNYKMNAFKDGVNAEYQAMHYNRVERTVDAGTTIDIHMSANGGWAAEFETVQADKTAKMDWFAHAKLGIFIHWGIYSRGEWSESWPIFNARVSLEDYMAQAKEFTAANYDPKAWVDLIEESGARYTVITTKHHDGFALWDTKAGDVSAVKSSPAGRDLVTPFTDEVRKRDNLKLGLYFSLIDWPREDYPNILRSGPAKYDIRKEPGRWQHFLDFNDAQMLELNKQYKPDLWWFDGDWEFSAEEWKAPELVAKLHSYNPDVIINSRIQGYGDYATPELGVPVVRPDAKWWETCMTINDSWGYRWQDTEFKSVQTCLRMLVDCMSKGGNLLLDIGPRADGTIPEEEVRTLKAIGRWTSKHAEAVYPTRAGIPADHVQGYTTLNEAGDILYVYLPYVPNETVEVKGLKTKIKKVRVVGTNAELKWELYNDIDWSEVPGVYYISVPAEVCDPNITVLALELDGPLSLYRGSGQVISYNP